MVCSGFTLSRWEKEFFIIDFTTNFSVSTLPRTPAHCDLCTYQLKSRPPPPTPGQGGGMWGFLWYWKARFARGGGGFLRICFAHSSKWGSEVGIGLVPSFLTVISAHGHWCRWLDCSAVLCSFVSVLVKRG